MLAEFRFDNEREAIEAAIRNQPERAIQTIRPTPR